MIDFEAELLAEHADWRRVLQAYRDEIPPRPEQPADSADPIDHSWGGPVGRSRARRAGKRSQRSTGN